jgi:tetratricopeptide (TPR) repeat protein
MQVVQDDPILLAAVRHYQGVAELRRLNPDACVRLLRNNIETMKKLSGDYDMSVQIASDYYVLSTALLACRDLDGAENCIRLADESCREGQTPTSTAMLQLNSGILACLRGQYEEALKNMSQAETIYLQTDFWENKGLLYGYMTITADRLGQAGLAARCRETCRKVLEETTNSLERIALREALGEPEAGGER